MQDPFSDDLATLVEALAATEGCDDKERANAPVPTQDAMAACQFSAWYPSLPQKGITIPSRIIDLPSNFIEYLKQDGIVLPQGVTATCMCTITSEDGDDDDSWSSSSSDEATTPLFDDLTQQIEQIIQEQGGAVIPKLNWSAPKDAAWMNGGTLKCVTAGDVYLLLKASDFCAFDLQQLQREQPQQSSVSDRQSKPQLILRKWCNLYPSQEFRVFVCDATIRAVCQRQATQYYPHLVEQFEHYQDLIVTFWDTKVRLLAPCRKAVVMDVYIDKKDRVWLLDFNVWGQSTDALLFDWSELEEMRQQHVETVCEGEADSSFPIDFRVVHTERQVKADPLSSYRAPVDVLQVQGAFEEFMNKCEKPSVLAKEDIVNGGLQELEDEIIDA